LDLLVGYYQRLLGWIIKGSFVDEEGVTHRNLGQTYDLTHWEVFNEPEGCHGLDVQSYTKQFDAIVTGVRKTVDPERKIKWVGLALSGREMDWITYFLNPANHDPQVLPLDYISFHFYASANSRTDPNGYSSFFDQADGFFIEAQTIMNLKNQLNPTTKIDCDELGVILPGDTDNNAAPFPLIYWNAAAGFYAYLFGNMAPMGYDVLGESQFAGVPPIPEWDILDAQFSGVSMVNWTTGEGTARYWVLRLLLDTWQPGDKFVSQTAPPGEAVFCAEMDYSVGSASLYCNDKTAQISDIQFAAYGTPTGTCGNYTHDTKCDATNVTAYVKSHCIGQNNCTILSYPTFGDPCFQVVKRFVMQASCTGSAGGHGTPTAGAPTFAVGAIDAKTGGKKVLAINKRNMVNCLNIDGVMGSTAYILDESSGMGPARKEVITTQQLILQPYAVAVVYL